MKRFFSTLFSGWGLVLALVLGSVDPVAAQENELEATLDEVGEVYARGYLQPLADFIGADLNAGLFETARVKRLGLNVYIGIRGAVVLIPEESRTFDLNYDGTVEVEVDAGPITQTMRLPATFEANDAPTIFGDTDEPEIAYTSRYDTTVNYLGIILPVEGEDSGTAASIGGLVDLKLLGSPVLHIRVGSVVGTDVIVRWIPGSLVDRGIELAGADPAEVGSASLFGLGARHGLNTYLPLLPLDVAVQAVWQQANLTDADAQEILKATTFAAAVHASKKWRFVSVFGGVQTEETRLRVTYTFEEDGITAPIDFIMTGAVKTRGVLGVGLHLGPVELHTSAALGEMTVFTTGIGLAW